MRGPGSRRRPAREARQGRAGALVALVASGALGEAVRPARADEAGPGACTGAYIEVQQLRKAAKLRAARGQALVCAQDVCTETVRTDCARWLDEIERAMPSILVDARDEAGNELAEVRVEAGGTVLVERLDGKQISIDPGEYSFRFDHRGRAVERRVIVREGEKYRTLRVQFPPAAGARPGPGPGASPPAAPGPASPAAPGPASPAAPRPGGAQPVPLGSYVLGGVAAAGLAAFGALALSGYLSETNLRDTCEPTDSCSQGDVDSIRTRYLVGDVALGVGVASAAGALALWALSPARPGASAAAGVRLVPFGPGAALAGRF